MNFSELTKFREEKGLSITQLSKLLFIPKKTIRSWNEPGRDVPDHVERTVYLMNMLSDRQYKNFLKLHGIEV